MSSEPAAYNPHHHPGLKFYRNALSALHDAGIPFVVGGAYAYSHYVSIARETKDFDIFIHPHDVERALGELRRRHYRTELAFPHWLGEGLVRRGLHGSHLRLREWRRDAWTTTGSRMRRRPTCSACACGCSRSEEMIWSKAFVMERERSDAADVAHLLLKCSGSIDWDRLIARFGQRWRVLFAHLVLFGFVYPSERTRVPARVVRELWARLEGELTADAAERVCHGTILSREQYLIDVEQWEYAGRAHRPARHDVGGGRRALDGGNRSWALMTRPGKHVAPANCRGGRPRPAARNADAGSVDRDARLPLGAGGRAAARGQAGTAPPGAAVAVPARQLREFSVTAYCTGRVTQSGARVKPGMAAADPRGAAGGIDPPGRRPGEGLRWHLHRDRHRPRDQRAGAGPLPGQLQRGRAVRAAHDAGGGDSPRVGPEGHAPGPAARQPVDRYRSSRVRRPIAALCCQATSPDVTKSSTSETILVVLCFVRAAWGIAAANP